MIRTVFCFIFTSIFFYARAQELSLVEQTVVPGNGKSFRLKIPKGYHITIAAEGLKRPRFFSKSPDGRIFLTDMYDRSDNSRGRVLILGNWNEKTKRFEKITTYLDSLHNPNQVQFYNNGRQDFIYVAETDKLSFYPYNAGDSRPYAPPKVIAHFPAYGLNYKYGGWHLTRSLAFHNNKLYVSIGSSCNACNEKEELRACILEMDPDGQNQRIFARGLRNSVGIKWVNEELWVSSMGRDLIGPDKPEDLFQPVTNGGFYGWPFYYQYHKVVYTDASFKDSSRSAFVKRPPVAPWGFKAHSAPLGFEYFNHFSDSLLNNSFLVALHGSTSVWRQRGNAVVQLMANGSYREIISGFLQGKTEDKRYGRPCDLIQWGANGFFISDDKNGVIYFVWKEN
jgi:glucose/arabinose dehydrogenase